MPSSSSHSAACCVSNEIGFWPSRLTSLEATTVLAIPIDSSDASPGVTDANPWTNDYAMICGLKKFTSWCQTKLGYYCDKTGKLKIDKSRGGDDESSNCNMYCESPLRLFAGS